MRERSELPGPRRGKATEVTMEQGRHLAGMDLAALRAYRHDLQQEEDRVSYWRRLVHARLDLLVADIRPAAVPA